MIEIKVEASQGPNSRMLHVTIATKREYHEILLQA